MTVFSNAVNELLHLQRELDSLLRSPRSDLFSGPSAAGVFPPINIFRNANGDAVIRAELPGVKPEQLSVTVERRRLTLSGERTPETPENGSYHRRERLWGKFSRSIELPADLDVDRAEASFRNGVMTLRIPRADAAKPRQITVHGA
jgi:HSP20 family protein